VEVIGVGAATWDDLWVVDDFSSAERVVAATAHVGMGGGPVATALCVLAHLGHTCALVDSGGDDTTGDLIAAELRQIGVQTRCLHREPGARSARAAVLVRKHDGARQIAYAPATAAEPAWGRIEDELMAKARLLHLNGRHESTSRAAVQSAQRNAVTISFDGGAGRYRPSIRDLLLASHLRIVAKDFALQCTGETEVPRMLKALLQPPAIAVVITDGIRGSWLATADIDCHHERACQANPLVDSTGCGDVYHGAFLHGWLSSWPPQRCAAYASSMAARNAEGLGGRHLVHG